MQSIGFVATFGVVPGYAIPGSASGNLSSMAIFHVSNAWLACMREQHAWNGVLVTGVASEGLALYQVDGRGASETVVSVRGELNPSFGASRDEYREAVLGICRAMRTRLRQTTVSVSFHDVDFYRLTDQEDA